MEQSLIGIFVEHPEWAVWISIIISILVSIVGVLPSVFVTAANIAFFGFEQGLYISIAGEAIGAIVSFYLYRKGVDKLSVISRIKFILRLQEAKGIEAFLLILALRLFPFAPSGLVTLAGASSGMGIVSYSIASTIGKIPALFIEAFAVSQVLNLGWKAQLILVITSLVVLVILYVRKKYV